MKWPSYLTTINRIVFPGWKRKVFAMFLIYFLCLLLGSFLFVWLEEEHEKEQKLINFAQSKLIMGMIAELKEQNVSNEDINWNFLHKRNEWLQNNSYVRHPWENNYGEKIMFSMTLLTSIGYGNVVPKSAWGKCVSMLYIVVGFPLNLTMVRLLSMKFRSFLRYSLESLKQGREVVACALFFAVFSVLFVLGPATLFAYQEHWTYSQAVYFSFISLSTIGLGDYVAGVSSQYSDYVSYPFYFALILVWLLFGTAYVLMTLNLLSYLCGLFLLDKLDCQCTKGRSRASADDFQNNLKELMEKLNQYTPEQFKSIKLFEEFPEDVWEERQLHQLLEAVEDVKNVARQEILFIQSMTPDS